VELMIRGWEVWHTLHKSLSSVLPAIAQNRYQFLNNAW
jgi:hypothetical protein